MRCAKFPIAGLLALVAASPLQAQQLGGGGGVAVSLWRIVAALLISAMAALALALTLRSRGGSLPVRMKWLGSLGGANRIRLIESRRIASQAELTVVQCDGCEYLILSGQGHAEVLERRELPAGDAGAAVS